MHISRRAAVALLAIAALAGSATTAISALGQSGSGDDVVLKTSLLPSDPNGPVIQTVTPGSAAWTLDSAKLKLTDDGTGNGELTVRIKGLLITGTGTSADGTVGPVTTVDASLFCGGDTTPFATTPTVSLTKKGNASIDTDIPLPGACVTPVILINPLGNTGIYIAASGFTG